jgi:hypothetical protein
MVKGVRCHQDDGDRISTQMEKRVWDMDPDRSIADRTLQVEKLSQ